MKNKKIINIKSNFRKVFFFSKIIFSSMNGLKLSIRKPSYPKKWFSISGDFSIDLKDYSFIRQLGTGSFGSVNLVSYRGKVYAMKNVTYTSGVMDIIKNESATFIFLSKLKELGFFIPELYCIFQSSGSQVHFLMEAVNGEELYNIIDAHIAKSKILTTKEILELLVRISYRLKLLHDFGIIHYDFKPENIMIGDKTIKFIDFGSSCINDLSDDFCYSHFKGSDGYVSPEMFDLKKIRDDNAKIGIGNDIWGFGVIIYLLFEQERIPLDDKSTPDIDDIKYTRINDIISGGLNPYFKEGGAGKIETKEEEETKDPEDPEDAPDVKIDIKVDTIPIFNHKDKRVYELIKQLLVDNIFVENERRITSSGLFSKLSEILNEYGYEYDLINDKIIESKRKIVASVSVKEGGYKQFLKTYLELKKYKK